ncbi:MAG: hypothetical protein JNM27_10010 [Leptospirales bacterium]|nr:hypothetical protein [Leptospirales bacterium]
MPLFKSGQEIQLTIRGEKLKGLVVYEKSKEVAVRLQDHPVFKNDSIWTMLKNEFIHGEYEQGPYHCAFDARMTDLDADRASIENDWVLNLQLPGKVRRTNKNYSA